MKKQKNVEIHPQILNLGGKTNAQLDVIKNDLIGQYINVELLPGIAVKVCIVDIFPIEEKELK